jgi:NADH-quinone oxidoreductase subunit L
MPNPYPLFIPLAPLIASFFTALPYRCLGDKNYKFGWWIIFAGFITSLLVLWQTIQNPEPVRIPLFASPWGVLPVVELSIDRLVAVMMVVISGFGTLLYHYSARYLQQDGGQGRYQTLLAIKLSTMLFVVSSADLLTLFIFWQVSGWFLSLLSHNYAHVPTVQGSFRTFIMLRAGDLAFLAGIALAYHLYGTVQFAQLFERAAADQTLFALFGTGLEITGATAVTLLIFIGAMSKSVQFPLHMWLPDSLYAPTPIHALLHAGGVNAGGFLLAPLYVLSPTTLHIALLIGLITAILGTSMMLVQNDIKKTLGYSTIGQMGYMIMECGLGAFPLAVFHLIAHGLFKADIFLNCGKGIHEARLHPMKPPKPSSPSALGMVGLTEAFVMSLLVPLLIAVGAHYVLGISFLDSQGLLILLLFSWVTASQAMLTLFRLKEPWLTKGVMLIGIALVATVYFFAAEKFTHFLIPDPNVVEAYLQAAELPNGLFLTLTALLVLSIAAGWFFTVYHRHNGKRMPWPEWLEEHTYLFFMNRLYLDGIALRLFGTLKKIGRMIDRSPVVFIAVIVLGLAIAFGQTVGLPAMSATTVALLLLSALLVPLFPFHGVYVAALTRAPRALATALCGLLPVLGLCVLTWLLPEIPKGLLPAISVLAIFGALWGSVKALLQVHVSRLLSYGGLALYSIFWWHFAQVGEITPNALLYAWTVTLVWGGLFLAWDRVRVRYGDLDLNRIGGLFQPMPRFAVCLGLLVMAAVGLPPFGLFFGYLGILLSPATGISFGLIAIIATWFTACWYLFRLMQQLLFGPHRKDLRYEDLRPAEIVAFVLVIALLVVPSSIPQDWLSATTTELTWNIGEKP